MKNKKIKTLCGILSQACVTFTVIVFAFYIFADAFSSDVQSLKLSVLAWMFCFSVWFALSNLFLKSGKIFLFMRVLLHFLSTVAGFIIFFILIPGNGKDGAKTFMISICFALLYILVATVILIIRGIVKTRQKDKEEYKTVYDKSRNI